jgi:two-component system, NtrC family, response regulator HydG
MATEILIVDDDRDLLELVGLWVRKFGHQPVLASAAEQALTHLEKNPQTSLVLLDIRMPGLSGVEALEKIQNGPDPPPVIMMTAGSSIEGAVECMRAGAYDYLPKPLRPERLEATLRNALERRSLKDRVRTLERNLEQTYDFDNVIGTAPSMQRVFQLVRQVADAAAPVLLTGESGVGKEVIARTLHFNSRRKNHPFVATNCAAIPADLMESELFGHERGAFTGAIRRRVGKLEEAASGTVLLDEIGEMDPRLQAKLLRVLQEREFQRIGSNDIIPLRARMLAATNRDLEKGIISGTFREDLYYRLNVVVIEVPPLRERRSDIPKLVAHMLRRFQEREGRNVETVTAAAMEALCAYNWPGNVRELENVIYRAGLVSATSVIEESALPRKVLAVPTEPRAALELSLTSSEPAAANSLQAQTEALIDQALALTGGNVTEAARQLGISRSTLYRKLKARDPAGDGA